MKNIPENIKVVINSVAPLLVTVVLFVLVGNFGISKINDLRTQIDVARVTQNILTQKLATLQSLGGSISTYSSAASVALPDSNTSLAVISQLKSLASANTLIISNIKSGTEVKDPTGLSRVDVSFDLGGGKSQVIAFLKAIEGVAPIIVVDKIKINEVAGASLATISVKSFWAVLPTTLPSSSQTLQNLTPDEQSVLTKVGSLSQPNSGIQLPSAGGAGRPNPFVQ